MNEKLRTYFSEAIPNCLLTYQYIEQSLRECLYRQHAIVRHRIEDKVPYNAPLDSIENAAMGRLVAYFKVFCNDAELISVLRKVKAKRDEIAHKGCVMSLEEQQSGEHVDTAIDDAETALKEAKKCLSRMMGELHKLDQTVKEVYGESET